MLHSRLLCLCIATYSLISACGGNDTHKASLDGHYESATAANMRSFESGQRALPEYDPVGGVIIALPLLTFYAKEQMALDLIDSGIDTLWITVPSSFKGSLASSEFRKLRNLLGSKMSRVKLLKQETQGSISIWARDWAPLGARSDDGKLRLLDFNYYPERGADDATARSMLNILPVERVSVPVYNEGGNFMNNSQGLCLMTSRVSDANSVRHFDEDRVYGDAEIKDYYQKFAGCQKTVIFPRMPYEGTGHIDMWAKFLSDKTLIVSEIRDEVLKLEDYSAADLTKVETIRDFLNERAAEIRELGYRVVRIPMPAPVKTLDESWMFRSYTNSLTSNKLAIVPRYVQAAYPRLATADDKYIDQRYLPTYEAEVIEIYKSLGYAFKWVNSDDLIADGGAVHCTTMQIAR